MLLKHAQHATSVVAGSALLPDAAQAPPLDGATLSWPWALPFAGILLTIATAPLLFPKYGTWAR